MAPHRAVEDRVHIFTRSLCYIQQLWQLIHVEPLAHLQQGESPGARQQSGGQLRGTASLQRVEVHERRVTQNGCRARAHVVLESYTGVNQRQRGCVYARGVCAAVTLWAAPQQQRSVVGGRTVCRCSLLHETFADE